LTSDRDTGGLIGGSNDGVIKNSSVDGTITSTGNDIGGLVANNNGTVTESTFSGEVTGAFRVGGIAGNNEIKGIIRNSSSAGEVTASNNNVGGIAGANGGLIKNSAATPAIQGNLTDGFNAGGLVGVNGKTDTDGTIESSYATGNIDGDSYVGGLVGQNFNGSIKNSYATGRVSGDSAGGLVGRNDGTVIGSYWDTDATGQAASAGSATGLNTAQMTGSAAQDSMSALDFDTVWNIQSGDYPILVHQADEPTDESSSVQVQLSNTSLTPQTVDSGSESTHRLTFEARNVSADGSEDNFDITFPNKVELVSYSNMEIEQKSSGVDMTANTP
jgi:The GLUG motif.